LCVSVWRREEAEAAAEQPRDTESKTRTPPKDVGNSKKLNNCKGEAARRRQASRKRVRERTEIWRRCKM
jgi:hypothetical protein